MKESAKNRLILLVTMCIFGTIGIFRRFIPLPSGAVACVRALVGLLTLVLVMLVRRQRPDFAAIRKNLGYLLCSGAFLGFNWVLLFEAYKYTTVATATLCYYMAPLLLVLLAPLFLGERLTPKKLICAAVALLGMALVSGVLGEGIGDPSALLGIGLGLAAAVLYACIVIMNKKMTDIGAMDKTVVQFAVSTLVLVPYVLLAEDVFSCSLSLGELALLLVLGVVHTGIAYALYFGVIKRLPAATVALYSYADPIVAVLLSALFLKEPMTLLGGIGAVLILSAAVVSER